MFDVGFPELFIVAVLAIVVVGPRDLPKVIRSVMGMIKKVREMGSEFQAGVKKMADEVELDAVTRKLNEAGNIKLDDPKPTVDPSAEFSDYAEFDYDEYDYDGTNYTPTPSTDKSAKSDEEEPETGEGKTDDSAEEQTPEAPDIVEDTEAETEVATIEEDKVKSKADD